MDRHTVSEWLKKYHHNDRTWLANKCNRSINTVYTWFSSRPIPKAAQIIIGKLMREDQSKQLRNQELPSSMVVEFSKKLGRPKKDETRSELISFRIDANLKAKLQKKADAERRSLSNYLLTIIEDKLASQPTPKVAPKQSE